MSAPQVTLFTIPKAFEGHVGRIQSNAFQSWRALDPRPEVLVFGDDPGVAEACAEAGFDHQPSIAKTSLGTPLLSDAFAQVEAGARNPLICYVNADIILLQDLLEAAGAVDRSEFLMIGHRWDWDVPQDYDIWPDDFGVLAERVRAEGSLHPPSGSDYFLFPKGIRWELPDFAVGRPQWDNWFIFRARSLGLPVVDATAVTTVIHQNHDYRHVPSGRGAWEGPEGDENKRLAAGRLCNILDATHVLTEDGLKRAWSRAHLRERAATFPALHPWAVPLYSVLRPTIRMGRGLRAKLSRSTR